MLFWSSPARLFSANVMFVNRTVSTWTRRRHRLSRTLLSRKPLSRQLRTEGLEDRRMMSLSATLEPIGTYATGVFDESAAEVLTYDADSERLFVTNVFVDVDETVDGQGGIDVLDIHDPTEPTLARTIDTSPYGETPTSVDVYDGLLAIATRPKKDRTINGTVVFFDIREENPVLVGTIEVGSDPDNLAFTPDGRKLVVANEGRPNDDYSVDPEGSVTIIDTSSLLEEGTSSAAVTTASFARFNDQADRLRRGGVRIFGPGATVAQDLEPEHVTISEDSRFAWVTLQENNAMAKVDLRRGKVVSINALGYKKHWLPGAGLDASNKDDAIAIKRWPVLGMYQPDAVASYTVDGKTYLVTANEGDARDYDGFSEEARVKDLTLAGPLSRIDGLQDSANLGRLKTTTEAPFGKRTNQQGEDTFSTIFSYGARSFSIWSANGRQVFDSGDDFEQITAAQIPDNFNSTNDENAFDNRSDDKGPEPEYVVVGQIDDRQVAFVALERVGGIMAYDVTNPRHPSFLTYVNTRDFSVPNEVPVLDENGDPVLDETGQPLLEPNPNFGRDAGDLAPEGMKFIPAHKSPTGEPLLAVAYEVSGTTTLFQIEIEDEDEDDDSSGGHSDRDERDDRDDDLRMAPRVVDTRERVNSAFEKIEADPEETALPDDLIRAVVRIHERSDGDHESDSSVDAVFSDVASNGRLRQIDPHGLGDRLHATLELLV